MSSPRTLFSNSADAISVGTLYRRSKNALAREFRGPVWVTGEIKQLREMRGNLYLQLIEPGDHSDGSDLSVDVAVWSKRHLVLKSQLADAGITLAAGMVVQVQGNVTLSKVSRLQLELVDLDTDALIGRQANEKKRLYAALAAEGLLDANRKLPVPLVPLRIGLVTSEGSEGHNDFMGQLDRSKYRFEITLRHSQVQGPTAAATLARAIGSFDPAFTDLVCVVRGGGGELDAFDKEPLARAIATSVIPIWTGIGHTGDKAVADDVANACYITPTECGQAVVRHIDVFDSRLLGAQRNLSRVSERLLQGESARINGAAKHLSAAATRRVDAEAARLVQLAHLARSRAQQDVAVSSATVQALMGMLQRGASRCLDVGQTKLRTQSKELIAVSRRSIAGVESQAKQRRLTLQAYDPKAQLRRGYAIVRTAEGAMVRSAADLSKGDELVTTFGDGTASSTVSKINAEEQK